MVLPTYKAGLNNSLKRPSIQNLSLSRDVLRVQQHINDNLDRLNQSFARFTDVPFVHGEEKLIPNPFGVSSTKQPVALFSGNGVDSNGNVLIISNYVISAPRADGFIGLTLYYDLRHTNPSLVMYLGADQPIPNNTTTTVDWSATERSNPASPIITDSAGTFTVSEAGLYQVVTVCRLESATYTNAEISIVSGGITRGSQQFPVAWTSLPIVQAVALFPLSAGGTFITRVYQLNTAPSSRNLLSGQTASRVMISRLYNDSTPTGIVSGVLLA